MDKRRKRLVLILCSLALLLIPVCGISLGTKGPLFIKSLSRIAGDGKHFGHLFLFGNLVILFLIISIYYLTNYFKIGNKRTTTLFIIACIFLECTVLTPYIPETNPLISKIHNYCAYFSISLLVITLLWLIISIPSYSRSVFKTTCILFTVIVTLCLTIYIASGRPSGFFEITLITTMSDLILIMIILLHHNEKDKINGTLDIKFKIAKNKAFNLYTYEAYSNGNENIPLVLKQMNDNWQEIESATSINPFKRVYVYYDTNAKKHFIGVNKSKSLKAEHIIINTNHYDWAVFDLDDTVHKTKEITINFIKEKFLQENEYSICSNIYMEKYFVTKRSNIRKAQIWIPVKIKSENNLN